MTTDDTRGGVLASGDYEGATAEELARRTAEDRLGGAASPKALFQRRGVVTLKQDRLVLGSWGNGGDLVLRRPDITSVDTTYTELYGRVIGGLLNAGKPLILGTTRSGQLYLLIDRKDYVETTHDRAWEQRIKDWLWEGR